MRGIDLKFAARLVAVSGLLAAAAGAIPAEATTATTSFQVTANVQSSCTVSATAMAFGTYSLTSGNTATSTITVTCTNGTKATIALDNGQNGGRGGSFGTRAMSAGGSNYLGYDIYTSTAYTTVWNTTNTQTVTSTGSPVNLTAYGRLPSGQAPATGSYTDTVTVTATF
ncbi:MAG TPA: spore coat U domain-containing protein [Alphaproteobacteria bacterium]|nr:spore coat U domain-containing protein [Alphaproteobacteria bacterium]